MFGGIKTPYDVLILDRDETCLAIVDPLRMRSVLSDDNRLMGLLNSAEDLLSSREATRLALELFGNLRAIQNETTIADALPPHSTRRRGARRRRGGRGIPQRSVHLPSGRPTGGTKRPGWGSAQRCGVVTGIDAPTTVLRRRTTVGGDRRYTGLMADQRGQPSDRCPYGTVQGRLVGQAAKGIPVATLLRERLVKSRPAHSDKNTGRPLRSERGASGCKSRSARPTTTPN